jgi:predicted transcriptional regulator of viral defense system
MQRGQYVFTSLDAGQALGVSRDAAKLTLNRLRRKGEVASPVRGFYVIVPPEYRSIGCLPAEQFIPALMAQIKLPYYAGLLSAAQYHGAAHHRPQEFQVMLGRARRPIECGKVRVAFHVRKRIADVPVQKINTPRGTVSVSTPAATAFDLIGYEAQIGGLDAVATILVELAEKLDPGELAALAPTVPLPWAQRLGYLLERIGETRKTELLKDYVRTHVREATVLQASIAGDDHPRDRDWKLIVNAQVEAET